MQHKNRNFSEFKQRMDALAAALTLNLTELPDFIGVSQSTLFANRAGKLPISSKTWLKLEHAETRAGLHATGPAPPPSAVREPSPTYGSQPKSFLEALDIIRKIEQDPKLFAVSAVESALGRPLSEADKKKTWEEMLSEIHNRQNPEPKQDHE